MASSEEFAEFVDWARQNPTGTYQDYQRSQEAAPTAQSFTDWAKGNPHGTFAQWEASQGEPLPDFAEWARQNPYGTFAEYQRLSGNGTGSQGGGTIIPGGFSLNQPAIAARQPQPSQSASIAYGSDPTAYADVSEASEIYPDPYTSVRYRLTFKHNGGKRGQTYGKVGLPDGRLTHTLYDTAYDLAFVSVA